MSGVDLAAAERMLVAGSARATELGICVSLAVVDAGGHLIAFRRMDGAEIAGPTLAVDKAYTSVAQSTSTAQLGELAQPGGPLFGIQANGGGRYVIFAGGVPIIADDTIIGGIGVSGGTADQDEQCAQAALAPTM